MNSATSSAIPIEQTEIPSMLATLCSYESWFGPYHPQTLHLMTQVGIAFWQVGEPSHAQLLLERAILDLERHVAPDNDLRLRAIAALRDLFIAQGDYERAASVQRELLECQVRRLGSDHPETLAARDNLAKLSFGQVS
jgi:hypothetical protein